MKKARIKIKEKIIKIIKVFNALKNKIVILI